MGFDRYQRRWRATLALAIAVAALSGCSTTQSTLPRGAQSYQLMPGIAPNEAPTDYRIGPLDVLSVNVFREPDLTLKDLQVDAGGTLLFPLVGALAAKGKTSGELAGEIARRLSERYLRDPQVTVVVTSTTSQRVVVEGNVTEPGVYEVGSNATLLEALARAKSTTRVAALGEVVVFRIVDGKRMGAVFDVRQIRAGIAADPRILGGDIVVVGFSEVKGAFRDFLSSGALFLNAFRLF